MIKLEEIKFGTLTQSELYFLQEKVKRETERRKTKPEEYFDVVHGNDGCEGFYCKVEDFGKIKSEELHRQISITLSQGSSISFSIEKVEKNDYNEYCKRYEWDFGQDKEITTDEEE